MSSPSRRRTFAMRHPAVVNLGCGCRGTKLSSLFSFPSFCKSKSKPKPKPADVMGGHCSSEAAPGHHNRQRHPPSSHPFSSTPSGGTSVTSSWETSRHPSSVSTNTSPYDDDLPVPAEGAASTVIATPAPTVASFSSSRGRVRESVAVVKQSKDPYMDFRQSMLQMILEKEIYAWEDLQELLANFLTLNAPYHHEVILRAFTEVWSSVYPPDAAA